jgi:hypothetical protein
MLLEEHRIKHEEIMFDEVYCLTVFSFLVLFLVFVISVL